MIITFNKQKLTTLLNHLGKLTGTALCFWDKDFNEVASSNHDGKYCNAIRSDKNRLSNCMLSDAENFIKAKSLGKTFTYTCHAGLTESVTPVYFNDVIVGYVIIGRFRDKERVFSTKENARSCLEKYGICNKENLDYYDVIPELSNDDIKSITEILEWSLKGFLQEGGVKIDRDILALSIEEYVKEHLNSTITVETIAQEFFLSKHALYNLFERSFHQTVNDFINTQRMNKAKELLLSTSKSISQIAEEIGFCDYNYFIRVFKKYTHTTPNKYRTNV